MYPCMKNHEPSSFLFLFLYVLIYLFWGKTCFFFIIQWVLVAPVWLGYCFYEIIWYWFQVITVSWSSWYWFITKFTWTYFVAESCVESGFAWWESQEKSHEDSLWFFRYWIYLYMVINYLINKSRSTLEVFMIFKKKKN